MINRYFKWLYYIETYGWHVINGYLLKRRPYPKYCCTYLI